MFQARIPCTSAFFCVASARSPQVPQLPVQTHAVEDGWTGSGKLYLGRECRWLLKSSLRWAGNLSRQLHTLPPRSHHGKSGRRWTYCPSSVTVSYITTFYLLSSQIIIFNIWLYNAPTTAVLPMFQTGKLVHRDLRSTTHSVPSGWDIDCTLHERNVSFQEMNCCIKKNLTRNHRALYSRVIHLWG